MRNHMHHPGHTHSDLDAHSRPGKELASRREFLWTMLATGVVVPFAFGRAQTRADMAERFRPCNSPGRCSQLTTSNGGSG
jgi:hypothetical protein